MFILNLEQLLLRNIFQKGKETIGEEILLIAMTDTARNCISGANVTQTLKHLIKQASYQA